MLTHSVKILMHLSVIFFIFLLSSCSYFLPHRIDIQQGNIIEQKAVNKLQPGMRKDQVQFILGTPMLVDLFHNNRWDYVYTMTYGHEEMKKSRLSLYFEDDELINIVGDFRPGVVINKEDRSKIITIPLEDYVPGDDKPWYSWLVWWDDDENEKAAANEPEPNAVNFSTKVPEIIEEKKRN